MKHYNERMKYLANAMGRGRRVMATADISAMHAKAQELAGRIKTAREEMGARAMEEGFKPEDNAQAAAQIEADVARYNALMGAIAAQEGEAIRRVNAAANRMSETLEARMGGLFADMIRGGLSAATISALSLPTTVTTGAAAGTVLLPKTQSAEIIGDVVDGDAVLSEFTVTQIPGLSMPRVTVTDVDGDDTADGVAAKEATLDAATVSWRRIPYAKAVIVPTSLLSDTNTAIGEYINARHKSMMRARLLKRIFAESATDDTYGPMSIYSTKVNVPVVNATDATPLAMLDAIFTAIGELPDEVRALAAVMLTPKQYYAMVRALSNGAQALFGKADESVLGFRAVLSTYATHPVVGDLSTIHVNFDGEIAYATESHAVLGTTDVVQRAYFDVQTEQPKYLRIVKTA